MLLALPLDIVTEVLGFLSYADLARVKTACRSLRDAIDNTASLSYTLALGINAMKEGSRTGLGSTQRLQKLRKYQENWRRLQFSARTDLPSTEDCYFEVSGAFAAFTIDDAKQKISFTQLPSELRGLEKRQWTIELTDPVRDFTIEPAMDLLVQLVKRYDFMYEVQLLTMSTGRPHPRAVNHIIEYDLGYSADDFEFLVIEDRLGILFIAEEAPFFVVIWNWETGEEYVLPFSENADVPSIVFLDPDHIMTPWVREELDAFDNVSSLVGLDVVDISIPHAPRRCCQLMMPQFVQNKACSINLVWDMPTSHNPKRATELSPAWFTPAPRDRIIGIEINAFDENLPDDADYWPYLLIVSVGSILRCMREAGNDDRRFEYDNAGDNQSSHVLKWDDWGPQSSRLFLHQISDTWVCFLHGMRYAMIDKDGANAYRVYDFDCTKFEALIASGACVEGLYVTEPQTHDLPDVFEEPVTTGLPFQVSVRAIPEDEEQPRSAVVLLSDGVILVEDNTFSALTL